MNTIQRLSNAFHLSAFAVAAALVALPVSAAHAAGPGYAGNGTGAYAGGGASAYSGTAGKANENAGGMLGGADSGLLGGPQSYGDIYRSQTGDPLQARRGGGGRAAVAGAATGGNAANAAAGAGAGAAGAGGKGGAGGAGGANRSRSAYVSGGSMDDPTAAAQRIYGTSRPVYKSPY